MVHNYMYTLYVWKKIFQCKKKFCWKKKIFVEKRKLSTQVHLHFLPSSNFFVVASPSKFTWVPLYLMAFGVVTVIYCHQNEVYVQALKHMGSQTAGSLWHNYYKQHIRTVNNNNSVFKFKSLPNFCTKYVFINVEWVNCASDWLAEWLGVAWVREKFSCFFHIFFLS